MTSIEIACQPTGDLSPWVDDRVRTCTLCACLVETVSNRDGTDWVVVDGAGLSFAPNGPYELCACYPPDSGHRTRGGRIHPKPWDPEAEIDEKPRHYGPGLNLPGLAFHAHNDSGGEAYYTDLSSSYWACGHVPPRQVRTAWDWAPANPDRLPPECCDRPMRWAPRGWCCRVSGRYFPPTLDGHGG